jgi:hypothetical protein
MQGVVSDEDLKILEKREEEQMVSKIRDIVLELVEPIKNTTRIVNTDNYYTSVQLLVALRAHKLYARGTLKTHSSHFPKAVILTNTAGKGHLRQAVDRKHRLIAVSWLDGSIVNLVSNADTATLATISRQSAGEKKVIVAPQCVQEYNKYMQGVDRLDQLRSRFSIADGHSFKKWYLKLAMAFIDIARCNAYISRKIATNDQSKDSHKTFMVELTRALLSGM